MNFTRDDENGKQKSLIAVSLIPVWLIMLSKTSLIAHFFHMQFSDSDKWYLKTSNKQIEIWSGRKQLQIRSTIDSDEESPGPVKEIKLREKKW